MLPFVTTYRDDKLSTRRIDTCREFLCGSTDQEPRSTMNRYVDVHVVGVCVGVWYQHYQSTRKLESMFANIYILDDVLSPASCSDVRTSTIWVLHPRKIRGNGGSACFVEKCTFHRGNACFVGKTWNARFYANLCAWFLEQQRNARLVEKCMFHRKMPNSSRNNCAHFMKKNAQCIAKCTMCREITMHISFKKNAWFFEKCLIARKTNATYSAEKYTFHRIVPTRRSAWCLSMPKCMFERTWWRTIECRTWWQTEGVGHTVDQPLRYPCGACGANSKTVCSTTGRVLPH